VNPTVRAEDERSIAVPAESLGDFVGQKKHVDNLRVYVQARVSVANRWITSCSAVPRLERPRWLTFWPGDGGACT